MTIISQNNLSPHFPEYPVRKCGDLLKTLSQIAAGIAIVAVLTLIAGAFTEPTQAPPAGNVNPPLNTSGTTQTKTGNLTFPLMYDSDNGGYYVDPAANSVLYRIYAPYLDSVSTINGGSPITSSNIGSQSVSYASSCNYANSSGSAGSAGSANSVPVDDGMSESGRIHNGEIMPWRYGSCSSRGQIRVTRCEASANCMGRDILCYCGGISWGGALDWNCLAY